MSQPIHSSSTHQQIEHKMKKVNNFMFDVYDEIGSGFSSKVYKGTNCANGCQVAIKMIQLKRLTNSIEKQLLSNEIRALNLIKHPNLLRSIQTVQTHNNLYIVTDLFQQNLQKVLEKRGKFNQDEIMSFLVKMSSGLCYLQNNGIIHRDIKPSNIFLTKEGGNYVLGDFGFCCFLNTPSNQKGYNVGSPLYMSPQAYKASIYSHQSDIWALAVCVLELILGTRPFSGLSYDQMLNQVCNIKFYHQFPISDILKDILDSMFELSLEKRIKPVDLYEKLKRFGIQKQEINLIKQNNSPVEIGYWMTQIQNHQKRSVSVKVNQNYRKVVNFRNFPKYKINRIPLSEKQNQKVFMNQDMGMRSKFPVLTDRSNQKNVYFNESSNHPPNPKILTLQKLGKNLLVGQQILGISSFSILKLLKIISCVFPKIKMSQQQEERLKSLPVDTYFNNIIQTINLKNVFEISHYLKFLLEACINQMLSNDTKDNELTKSSKQKLIEKLRNTLNLWENFQEKKSSPQILHVKKNSELARSSSVDNLKLETLLRKKDTLT